LKPFENENQFAQGSEESGDTGDND